MTLGEKIKNRRQFLGLTQQDLAGDNITRNMLSQIENGAALPSLSTLHVLSKRLKMPSGYFLSEEDNVLSYLKLQTHSQLIELYRQHKYEECIVLADNVYGDLNDDDTAFFRCQVYCKAAEKSMYAGAMQQALRYAEQSTFMSHQTSYETDHLLAIAMLVSAICKNPNAPRLALDEKAYQSLSTEITRQDLYHYLIDDLEYQYHNKAMSEHMYAKKLMRQNKFELAYQHMEHIHENPSTEPIPAYVLWRLYSDMEICARNKRDFESAYRISTKRMSLLTAFHS